MGRQQVAKAGTTFKAPAHDPSSTHTTEQQAQDLFRPPPVASFIKHCRTIKRGKLKELYIN